MTFAAMIMPALAPAYLRQIGGLAGTSSPGPLSDLLQFRLADLWGMAPNEIVLLADSAGALAVSLRA